MVFKLPYQTVFLGKNRRIRIYKHNCSQLIFLKSHSSAHSYFCLFINNVSDVLHHFKIQLHADDSKLYGDVTTIEQCQAFERDILAVKD